MLEVCHFVTLPVMILGQVCGNIPAKQGYRTAVLISSVSILLQGPTGRRVYHAAACPFRAAERLVTASAPAPTCATALVKYEMAVRLHFGQFSSTEGGIQEFRFRYLVDHSGT